MATTTRRSTGTATITFGFVSIPAKFYAAVESKSDVSFHLLHGTCSGRVRQQYVCASEACAGAGRPVDRADMVRGYEYEPDKYAVLSTEELKSLGEESTEAIEVVEFVPAGAIDPISIERAQYLAPDKAGHKAFAMLAEAMRRSGCWAIGKYAARGKQSVVALRPDGPGRAMVAYTLRYADEVRETVEYPVALVDEEAVALAVRLVAEKTSPGFDAGKYRDDVRDRTMALIRAKVAGAAVAPVAAPEKRGEVIDLMAALRASLEKKEKAA